MIRLTLLRSEILNNFSMVGMFRGGMLRTGQYAGVAWAILQILERKSGARLETTIGQTKLEIFEPTSCAK